MQVLSSHSDDNGVQAQRQRSAVATALLSEPRHPMCRISASAPSELDCVQSSTSSSASTVHNLPVSSNGNGGGAGVPVIIGSLGSRNLSGSSHGSSVGAGLGSGGGGHGGFRVGSLGSLSESGGSAGFKWYIAAASPEFHNSSFGSLGSASSLIGGGGPGLNSPMFVKCMGGREGSARINELSKRCSSSLVRSSLVRFLEPEDNMVEEVERGFAAGHMPKLAEDCCGGTYFVKDRHGEIFAVYKPVDEEPYAPENPKGYVGTQMYGTSPMKEGVEVGKAAERECAAYLLDHNDLARVPRTILLRIRVPQLRHLKFGSLQRYIKNICTVEDMGPSRFPTADVHAIAMLDIRTCNSDRHVGNILVVEDEDSADGGVHLVPIDHGYVLPKWRYLHELDFCWMNWPQAKQPFTQSELAYIDSLDPDAESELLRAALQLTDDCLRTLRIGTTLLKTGVAAGLTLHDMGQIMVRPDSDTRSTLEEEVCKAEEATFKDLRRCTPHMLRSVVSGGSKGGVPTNGSGSDGFVSGEQRIEQLFTRHLTFGLQRVVTQVAAAAGRKPLVSNMDHLPSSSWKLSGMMHHLSETANSNNSQSNSNSDSKSYNSLGADSPHRTASSDDLSDVVGSLEL